MHVASCGSAVMASCNPCTLGSKTLFSANFEASCVSGDPITLISCGKWLCCTFWTFVFKPTFCYVT